MSSTQQGTNFQLRLGEQLLAPSFNKHHFVFLEPSVPAAKAAKHQLLSPDRDYLKLKRQAVHLKRHHDNRGESGGR
jgi:hypothetical protein